ncbi:MULTISPECIES: NAD-dependent succinate-semialdehyde dehydrogenase [unclassified Streptomyces]|uniref:NAD-dependent succinate-semialdehyde dehydrogenase n=1 Tax=unclassified Streptomyces TaxID=2593676 RepID=UPI002E1E5136|nr:MULTISPECIES: NAD-dependent succinate-semialdehyde dehydrogenase [unclassified Streptomyces]
MTAENSARSTSAATLYIDGTWRAAALGREFDVFNPADGSVLGAASDGSASEARSAVDSAAAAFASWSRTTAYERAAYLERAHALMLERAEDLAVLMTKEQGKPLKAARNEVRYAADFLSWYAEEAKRVYGATIPSSRAGHRFMTMRHPVGVVAAITPWNYPVSMITRKVAPAIAAGCTIVLKPAEQTPLCAVAVFQVLHDAGLPAGVVNLVTTSDPAPVGDALLDSPAVRKLTFTGSTEVGMMLGAKAAQTVKRVSLELGGHAPFLVFGDADPRRAAKGLGLVKFLNTGQACICPNRVFVQRELVDDFLDVLVQRVSAMKAGNGLDQDVSIGPLIDEAAMTKMRRQVADAVGHGAKVLTGGERLTDPRLPGGRFFAPTILTDVTPRMDIYHEETFGPIAPVIAFDDEDEAIAMANDTAYGLAAYVYTENLSRALRVTEALRFGIVGINDINPTSAAAPFGGTKHSGLGREGGPQGIDEYLDTKLVGITL